MLSVGSGEKKKVNEEEGGGGGLAKQIGRRQQQPKHAVTRGGETHTITVIRPKRWGARKERLRILKCTPLFLPTKNLCVFYCSISLPFLVQ